jgi:hypothetical protein
MTRVRAILGIVAGVVLLLSGGAHSFLGWAALRDELTAAGVPSELAFGVKVGWQFGGVCMFACAAIVLSLFTRRLRGETTSAFPALAIGLAYALFGAWALVASDFSLFFLVFLVPGILLLGAALGDGTAITETGGPRGLGGT